MTQCERVIQYMRDFGSITQRDAMNDLGIMRLASRISDLKTRGYHISSTMEVVENRYGEKTKVSRYRLEER